eukprot:TRINITY_DN12370_c0_g1_i2.p1 TRINITY_DN12370_c0_g1~~TRINITY_DN12370_c0_g1_i2.p1  ORF type:complete len:461 (-),score=82.72 TRINITY_DN12370_c0_g1_i2:401-1678(-)
MTVRINDKSGLPPINLPTSRNKGHQMLDQASIWLANRNRDGVRTLDVKNMYTTKGGSFTARSFDKMSDPAQKLVVASGALSAREMRKVGERTRQGETQRLAGHLNAEERELVKMVEAIADKAAQRYATSKEVFKGLDSDRDGKIERGEVRYFFRSFGYTDRDADRFWDHIDASGRAAFLSYDVFVNFFRPFLRVAFDGKSVTRLVQEGELSVESHSAQIETIAQDFHETLVPLRYQAGQRFTKPRDALKCVQGNCGQVTRGALRHFFRIFNMPEDVSDALHKRLDFSNTGDVAYEDFAAVVGRYLGVMNAVPNLQDQKETKVTGAPPEDEALELEQRTTFRGSGTFTNLGRQGDPKTALELRETMQDIGSKIPAFFKKPHHASCAISSEFSTSLESLQTRSLTCWTQRTQEPSAIQSSCHILILW